MKLKPNIKKEYDKLKEKYVQYSIWLSKEKFLTSTILRDLYEIKDENMRFWRECKKVPDFRGMIKKQICPNTLHKQAKLKKEKEYYLCPLCKLRIEKKRIKMLKQHLKLKPKPDIRLLIDSLYEKIVHQEKLFNDEKKKKQLIGFLIKIYYMPLPKKAKEKIKKIQKEIQDNGLEVAGK